MVRRWLLALTLVVFLAVQWAPGSALGSGAPDGVDKLVHAALYAWLAGVCLWGLRVGWIEVAATVILAYVVGLVMEVGQSLVPGRSPSQGDLLADVVGATAMALALALLRGRPSRTGARK